MILFSIALLFAPALCPRLLALDDHNPIGVTGAFEGVITTGGAYNVLSHNATRQIDDIVVPGAIGKYGLKMTRYYNSRRGYGDGWSNEYGWFYDSPHQKYYYPNGNVWDNSCTYVVEPVRSSRGLRLAYHLEWLARVPSVRRRHS